MFKIFGTVLAIVALCVPVAYATHCNNRVVERVRVFEQADYAYQYDNIQAVVLVPHQKLQAEYVLSGYDYQPQVQFVEKRIERVRRQPVRNTIEKVVEVPAKVVQRFRDRPRLQVREKVVVKEVIVKEQVRDRNVKRVRVIQNNGY